MAAHPLISIVIPTAGRPDYLPRAVESALRCAGDCGTEVIVVPNGPDESWRASLGALLHNPSVRILPIPMASLAATTLHSLW